MRERTLTSMVCLVGILAGAVACRNAANAPRAAPDRAGKAEGFTQRCFRYQSQNDVKFLGEGRLEGPFEFRGVCVRSVGQKEEIGRLEKTGTFQSLWRSRTELVSCSVTSTTTVTYDSGSFTGEGVSTCTLGPDGKLAFESNGAIVRGTGVYQGIRGTTSAQVNVVSPGPPELDYDLVEVRYSLPAR